jgi:hypothetical protein
MNHSVRIGSTGKKEIKSIQPSEVVDGMNERKLEFLTGTSKPQPPSNEALKALSALMDFMHDKEENKDASQNQDEVGIHFVNATIARLKVSSLVDTGSIHSFVGEATVNSLRCKTKVGTGQYKEVNSTVKQEMGLICSVPLRIGDWFGNLDLVVVPLDDYTIILGQDFFQVAQAIP